jgi:hypothetical protein
MSAAKPWQKVQPLPPEERVDIQIENKTRGREIAKDELIQVHIPK